MSLLSLLFEDEPLFTPRRDNMTSFFHPLEAALQPLTNSILNHLSNLKEDSSMVFDKDKFQANIDVQQFRPEEITVKLTGDNSVTVEGKHEEKQDEHGYISRHFVRRYELPGDCDVKQLKSKLSSDGVLSIAAPKKPESKQMEYRQIPILKTGPIRKIEQGPKKEADDAQMI